MSETLWRLIDELKPHYDMIFLDASPVGVVTDAAIIATKVDGTIFVVRAGEIKKAQLTRATDLLKKVNAHVLGFILNGASKQTDDYYNYYYNNTYYYSNEPHPADAKHTKKRHKNTSAQREQSGRFRELERNFYQAADQQNPSSPAGQAAHSAPIARPAAASPQQLPYRHRQPGSHPSSQPGSQPGQSRRPIQQHQAGQNLPAPDQPTTPGPARPPPRF